MEQKNKGLIKKASGYIGAVVIGLIVGVLICILLFSANYSHKAFEQSRINAQQLDKLETIEESLGNVEPQTVSNSHQIDLLRKDLRKLEKGKPLDNLSESNET